MNRKSRRFRRSPATAQQAPLIHPSWLRSAAESGPREQSRIDPRDFWERLGL